MKEGVVLVQLGSPLSPRVSDVRRFLREFLGDPRVVDAHPLFWKIILNLFILPFRPRSSAKLYQRIWDGKSFPLIELTKKFASRVNAETPDHIQVKEAFILSEPRVSKTIDELLSQGCHHLTFVPMFPQYAEASTASAFDAIQAALTSRTLIPSHSIVSDFHDSEAYIASMTDRVNEFLTSCPELDLLVFSFHGYPLNRIFLKKDPYLNQCLNTAHLISARLLFPSEKIKISFQSKFGRDAWLEPATDKLVCEEAQKGNKNIAVVMPGFTTDCLETLDEIGHELKIQFLKAGGKNLYPIPCLNDYDPWVKRFSLALSTKNFQRVKPESSKGPKMPEQTLKDVPLSKETKKQFKSLFLILFLDLMGFSMIFPLFPAMLQWYTEHDYDSSSLQFFLQLAQWTRPYVSQGLSVTPIVLFGGVLGSIYSLLQFLGSPLWGALSDRVGRKPVLITCLLGLCLSYVGWFFAGTFLILILARVVGGLMAGNISVASAAVADMTTRETRSKGMAIIGMAFGLGFIFGPAIGGLLSHFDLSQNPTLQKWGANPFSVPALGAFILSAVNLLYVQFKFKETFLKTKPSKEKITRTLNPIHLFRTSQYPGVTKTLWSYFIFLSIFSGMEFTLTFLTSERFQYSPSKNGAMFSFIGVLLALVQGGYVRRKAHLVGEKKMALHGLACLVPGLICVGYASSTWMLYLGLFFLALGSAMTIPCLTSLVSVFTPLEEQGRVLGVFRSMGALSRAVGPLLGAILYWQLSSRYSYLVGGLAMLIPIFIAVSLPENRAHSSQR